MGNEPDVRPLVAADVAEVTRLLVRSHADYPARRAVWPGRRTRMRALTPFTRATVADAAAWGAGSVGVEGGSIRAAAVWLPPGAFPWTARRKLRATPALLRTALAAPTAFGRFAGIGAAAERAHPTAAHWYLETLGVEPTAQGRGWGRRVLGPRLEWADAQGLPCYVETSDPANEAFYRGQGFEVVAPRLEHLPGGPPYLGMLRPPRLDP
jgi:ribosomal protein S18 acetylase RimI-like enzyme